MQRFEEEYKKLNSEQKEAVDHIDGPVMVVAGPGTGKTQILSLRIANILNKTDTGPDGILCLTFTNSGVSAMRERLLRYIGPTSSRVNIATFHSFGMKIIEEFYTVLDFDTMPKLMDDTESIALFDQILKDNMWDYLSPRADVGRYFRDLKSLISSLKRDAISPEDFLVEIEREIKKIEEDSESISTRGESKGQLKKDVIKKIEGLNKSREVVKFYKLYEMLKNEKSLLDYDDVLEFVVKIISSSDDVRDSLREKYLYILIDEHQDSSGVQNQFLKKVWGDVEKPNIFVVGDDRQLIYGFGGASLSYFEGFKHSFGKAKLITLVDNYRSTQIILDFSNLLLESVLTKDKLVSHHNESHPIKLIECDYPRDEIIACGLDIKEKIKQGIDINDIAVLVPKNKQVRSAVTILSDMGLQVSGRGTMRLFDSIEYRSFVRFLKIINNPNDLIVFSEIIFDPLSGVDPIMGHKFIKENDIKKIFLFDLSKEKKPSLFEEKNSVEFLIKNIALYIERSKELNVYSLVQMIGDEILLSTVKKHEELVSRVEIIRTVIHLLLSQIEKNPKLTLLEFLLFLERLESYDENIPIASFGSSVGIKVLTLHSSKGLEFDYVWIAHSDERSLTSGKKQAFSLPEAIASRAEQKDEEVIKRQLYVAITRAKRFCSISYAVNSYTGASQELAHVVSDLPQDVFEKQNFSKTEEDILKNDPRAYVEKKEEDKQDIKLEELKIIVKEDYAESNVSVSLLNNFFECPWKWYFRNLLKLPETISESLEFGNAVHGSIDKILQMSKVPTEKEILNIVNSEVSKRKYQNDKKYKQVEEEVFGIISNWVKSRFKEIEKSHENEKSISLKDDRFPHLNIYGKLDLIENISTTSVRVTDFKTGTVKKDRDIEKINEEGRMSNYLRQLAMYSYLLQESPKWRKSVTESRLEFLEAKKTNESIYSKFVNNEEIALLVKDIRDYDDLIKSGEWVNLPCNYNSYGKNTECEYCKMASIYK
jgi:DNA helicase-2/ATP-dependent DNA helicase PcrA